MSVLSVVLPAYNEELMIAKEHMELKNEEFIEFINLKNKK